MDIVPKTPLFDSATFGAELTWMHWIKVTQNEAVFKGRDNYTGDRQAVAQNFVGLAINFTPTWFQVSRASTCWRRSPGATACPATPRCPRRQRGRRQLRASGIAADIYQKYRFDLKYTGYYRRLLDQPGDRRRPRRLNGVNGVAVRPRLGVAHVQDHVLRRTQSCFSKTQRCALAFASLLAARALAAVSADEAKQLGTTLTPVGAEKAANKDGTIPAYTGGLKAPAGFKAGSGIRPDPFASEKPRLVDRRQEHGQHADKLTEGTKELLQAYPTMRVDVYPTHRTVALPQRVLDNTAKNATGAKTVNGGVALENVLPGYPVPDPEDRQRGDVEPPACASTAWPTTAEVRATGTSTPPASPTLATDGRRVQE